MANNSPVPSTVPFLERLKTLVVGVSATPWTLESLDNFPITTWNVQLADYQILTDWYKGINLAETVTDAKTKKQVEKFPIRINPIRNTCEKHAATLLGTALDSIHQGAMPIKVHVDPTDKSPEDVKRIEKAINKTFADSNAGAIFMEDAVHSQYLGGCVWALSYIPGSGNVKDKLLLSSPLPSEFVGIPDGTDYYNLKEAWVVKSLTFDELKQYVNDPSVGNQNQNGNDVSWWYVEHWTKTEHTVQINGTDIITNKSNPFGVVPVVYIPHIRTTRFRGESVITDMVKGLVREINLREADVGDAVSEDTHNYIWVRNVRGSLSTVQIGDGRPIVNLGSTSGLTGNESNPDMQAVNNKSASSPILDFNKSLYDLYRIEVNHPAVADGVDQGSQRSSVTLNARMWPLTSHVEAERVFWSVGMATLAHCMLIIMANKELNGITEKDLDSEFVIEWSPMLPRDREAIVQEVAIRAKNKVGSRKHLMSILGDTQDLDAELEQIRSELDLDPQTQQGFGADPGQSGGGNGTSR
jgi:hypothetical protein